MNVLDIIARYEEIIARKRMPKEEFYRRCGITSSAVSQWRKGKTKPSNDTLHKMANELGVTYEFLAYGTLDADAASNTEIDMDMVTKAIIKAAKALEANGVSAEKPLDPVESELLDLMRQLPDDKKATALEVIRAMAVAAKAL